MFFKNLIFLILLCLTNGNEFEVNSTIPTTVSSIDLNATNSSARSMQYLYEFESSASANKKINAVEYRQFQQNLLLMSEFRMKNMIRLENYYRSLLTNGSFANGAKLADLTFRVYDSETGIQYEDEFDCDLNLLVDCESSLLRKIEIIEGRWVVFTVNRTEEEEVSSQIDVLNVCRSMDKEFTCLINYADKCEKKMNWSTFSILKYIITQNNETIVSCKQKEIDWLGPPNDTKYQEFYSEEFIDQNGISHHLSHSNGPCIPWQNISYCWTKNMGIDFVFGQDEIIDEQHCQSAYHFERCLKKYLYEEDNFCSLDEKEASLQIILGSVKWNLVHKPNNNSINGNTNIPNICLELRHQWFRQKPVIGMQEKIYKDHWDRCKRFAFDLRHDFGSLLDPYCDRVVKKFDKPCENRFERRLRYLWQDENHGQQQIDPVVEKETVCCSISEFKQCVSIYVLIRCGKDSFRYFNNRAKIAQLDQCNQLEYGQEVCSARLNFNY